MRDKDGRALVNAHVLGFLRRICKLLFYGIKPVFVFDGAAPVLKRMTIMDRKKRKAGAAASHAKVAEKLLAAQMRREALTHVRGSQDSTSGLSKGKEKDTASRVVLDSNAVYLEDIDNSAPKTPSKAKLKEKAADPSSSPSKKNRFLDHDPYRLPEVDIEEVVAKATRATAPDPRLATEEELRAFIEDMRPEDFDVTSPAFRELPTEVQYEIVGDLRLKSRQTSYKRLQNMLKNAQTPLDFSRQQIRNLQQRNALTQQLLMTTDSIGKAHITIPVRIASERNKEYVLMKNEGESGGWILGIRDDGTQTKPIEIDQDSSPEPDDLGSDEEMEEVDIPVQSTPDPDLREYRRGLALSAIGKRYSPKKLAPLSTKPILGKSQPLFDLDDDDEMHAPIVDVDSEDDETLAFAIQESLDQAHQPHENIESTHRPIASSSKSQWVSSVTSDTTHTSPQSLSLPVMTPRVIEDDNESMDLYTSTTRLETALAIANAGPSPRRPLLQTSPGRSSTFGQPVLLNAPIPGEWSVQPPDPVVHDVVSSEDDMEEVIAEDVTENPVSVQGSRSVPSDGQPSSLNSSSQHIEASMRFPETNSDGDQVGNPHHIATAFRPGVEIEPSEPQQPPLSSASLPGTNISPIPSPRNTLPLNLSQESYSGSSKSQWTHTYPNARIDNQSEEEGDIEWSRSPSPDAEPSTSTGLPGETSQLENWDAAQEMDVHTEEGEFARFMSQVKGRDLDAVRKEIDDEIKSLNHHRKTAMRDSEDITHQMNAQIMLMLRLFGIPYITAPMEAEAQCAELVSLGLVDGIITDDSDVFLFGGQRVFKNMFNQSKTVECFLLSDLSRELGLDRDTLVRLAYLLGSDYVDGLPGVGPVIAMELLKEFSGEDGLHKFKDWWTKVQTGKDKEEDNHTTFRKRFKKKHRDLYMPSEWPNPAVRDEYYHPTVDKSEEPFKWGLPDLDALRDFFHGELGWNATKVDDLLLPIIQKMNKRQVAGAVNKQGNLNEYFDVTAGNGTFAPRKHQAYASKRLQQIVSDFRKEKGRVVSSAPNDEEPAKKKTKLATAGRRKEKARGGSSGKGKGGRGQAVAARRKSVKPATEDSDSADEEDVDEHGIYQERTASTPPPLRVELRPRPKPKPAYKGHL